MARRNEDTKNVLILASQEHLRLGYSAVLSGAGYVPYTAAELAPELLAAIVDMGDELGEHAKQLTQPDILKIIYIVSDCWAGVIPPAGAERYILHKPATAEAIIKCLRS